MGMGGWFAGGEVRTNRVDNEGEEMDENEGIFQGQLGLHTVTLLLDPVLLHSAQLGP